MTKILPQKCLISPIIKVYITIVAAKCDYIIGDLSDCEDWVLWFNSFNIILPFHDISDVPYFYCAIPRASSKIPWIFQKNNFWNLWRVAFQCSNEHPSFRIPYSHWHLIIRFGNCYKKIFIRSHRTHNFTMRN